MYYGSSIHIFGTTSLFTSYDTKRNTTRKVSVSDGKKISIVGSGDIKVSNGTCQIFNIKLALLGSLTKIITSTAIKHKKQ